MGEMCMHRPSRVGMRPARAGLTLIELVAGIALLGVAGALIFWNRSSAPSGAPMPPSPVVSRPVPASKGVLVSRDDAGPITGVHRAGPDAADFPPGTVLVAYGPPHGRTCFATEARWESIDFSPDGTRLILRSAEDSFVLRADDLRVVQRLRSLYAWWEGTGVGYLDSFHGYI